MSALHEISSRYLEAMNELTEPGADVPDNVIADTMEAMDGELEDKAINVAKYIKNLDAEAMAIDSAVAEMIKRMKAVDAKAERLRSYLKLHMTGTGNRRIACPLFVISVKNNPESVKIVDTDSVPAKYKTEKTKITNSISKQDLKRDLKSGIKVRGAVLVNGTRLEIK